MTSMVLGLATPILTRTQDGPARLAEGTIEDVAHIVGEADRLGFDSCTGSEHVGVPDTEIGRRGAAYWDPLATFGFLAARTSTSRFVTWVLVLAYHHPLARRRADLGRRPHAPFAATCRRAGRWSSSARWPRWFASATRAYRRRGPRCRRDTRPSPRGAKEGPFLRAASARRS